MALLTRPTKTDIFGSTALAAELTEFGSTTPSTDINLILNGTAAKRGWGTVGANDFPPLEWFNALGYGLSYYNAYLMQQGIPEWTTLQNYYINSYAVGSDGKLYRSKTGVSGTPNVGNTPVGDTVNWDDHSDVAGSINAATSKATPVDADLFGVIDSAVLKKTTWANIKTTLGVLFAPLASPDLTGTPTAPTATAGTNSKQIASTAFVKAHGNEGRYVSGISGSVVLTTANLNGYLYADVGTNIFQLPAATVSPIGSTITIYGLSAGFTITSTSSNIYANNTLGVAGIVVYKGASITLSSNGSAWIQVSSSRNLGEGQSFSAQPRAKDVVYTNTSGMAIEVVISIQHTTVSARVDAYVNGVRVVVSESDGSKTHSFSFIVPNGAPYYVSSISGTTVIMQWSELR